jgi:soluble lytic murein transglycosylase-like protein
LQSHDKKECNGVKVRRQLAVAVALLFAAYAAADTGAVVLTASAPVLSNAPAPAEAAAEKPAMKIFKYTNRSGVRSYSDRAPIGIAYEEVQLSCYACNIRSTVNWGNTPLQLNAYEYAINSAAKKYRVDPALVRAVIHAESAFRPGARSKKRCAGTDAIDAGYRPGYAGGQCHAA